MMKEKWQQLNQREQHLVISMAVVIGVFILYSFIWQPLNENITKTEQKLKRQQELLSWVDEKTKIISQSGKGNTSGKSGGSLSSVINRSAQLNNIAITRIQPQGDDIQVWIDEVVFSRFLPWIEHLAIVEGIQVTAVDLSNTAQPGVVKVRRLQLGK